MEPVSGVSGRGEFCARRETEITRRKSVEKVDRSKTILHVQDDRKNKSGTRGVYYRTIRRRTGSAGGQQDCAGAGGSNGELLVACGEGETAAKSQFEIRGIIDSDSMESG